LDISKKIKSSIVLSDKPLREKVGKEIRRELIEECGLEMILRLPQSFYERVRDEMNVLFFLGKRIKEI